MPKIFRSGSKVRLTQNDTILPEWRGKCGEIQLITSSPTAYLVSFKDPPFNFSPDKLFTINPNLLEPIVISNYGEEDDA